MREIFLTSRYTDDIYRLIVNACAKNSLQLNSNTKYVIKKIEIKKKININFFLFIFKNILFGKFFYTRKIVKLSYNNINVGRYLISRTYRTFKTYDSKFFFYLILLKNIYLISRYIETANYYLKNYNFKSAYLDHCFYLNGIFFDIFKQNQKVIYTNNYPVDIIRILPSKKKLLIEDCLKLKKKNQNLKRKDLIKTKLLQKKFFNKKKSFLFWMNSADYKKMKILNLHEYEYIIYAHSFTDAQLIWGVDSFSSMLDWLEFTINELNKRKKKIIVKAHPNFYLKNREIYYWERNKFSKVVEKYKKYNNILFINESINNYEIMEMLNKKCIAITHHGSVGIELIYNNFKVISSSCNQWDKKFKVSNIWHDIKSYKKILNLNWNSLKHHSKKDFFKLINNLFLREEGYFGKKFHLYRLRKYLIKNRYIKKNIDDFDKVTSEFNNIKNKKKIIDKLYISINDINV